MHNKNTVISHCDDSGIATVYLNRAEVHNAFDDHMIIALTEHLLALQRNQDARVVILKAHGKNFSAGADLNWMKNSVNYNKIENFKDSLHLSRLMHTMYHLNKPTIACVKGAVYGGGVGLVACCDITLAADTAKFCFSEVKLGLIPAVISPYIIKAIGERQAQRYFLTAECFNATTAVNIGLAHELTTEESLEQETDNLAKRILKNGPDALSACKQLIHDLSGLEISATLQEFTAETIANIRSSTEAQEGLNAFFEKRPPAWIPK